jgi:hypothetical protein
MVFLLLLQSASSSSCRVVCMVDCTVGKFQIAFINEASLGNEHGINVVNGNKCFQLFCMMCQAVGVPQGEL